MYSQTKPCKIHQRQWNPQDFLLHRTETHTRINTYLLPLKRISKNKENHKPQHRANRVTCLVQTFLMFTWLFCSCIDVLHFMCEQRISGKYLFLYHVALGGRESAVQLHTVWYRNCGFWPQVVADDSQNSWEHHWGFSTFHLKHLKDCHQSPTLLSPCLPICHLEKDTETFGLHVPNSCTTGRKTHEHPIFKKEKQYGVTIPLYE